MWYKYGYFVFTNFQKSEKAFNLTLFDLQWSQVRMLKKPDDQLNNDKQLFRGRNLTFSKALHFT